MNYATIPDGMAIMVQEYAETVNISHASVKTVNTGLRAMAMSLHTLFVAVELLRLSMMIAIRVHGRTLLKYNNSLHQMRSSPQIGLR